MSDNTNLSSDERLMMAAINLISEKGYNGATTIEIAAAAGLSEKTLFRRFASKQNLIESAFDRYHYAEEMRKLFSEKIVWDLYTDLLLISRTYHDIMNRNRKMIQISMKEEMNLPGFKERTQKHPQQLLAFLTKYLEEMADKEKVLSKNPELQAFSFMMANFGAFVNDLEGQVKYPTIKLDDFISENVELFTRALTP
ncbi:TetR/AcrR family transcriptional regulator [Paenibacillus sp. GSMTC-2017]|uniref:TetR/AcrR family transcriptional regulator n=1 Tax=Paenibacillus sp. GSMTC-2017 TaxID=2794350 RepID=UPI0018D60D9F|nr:TetR/AcrR family transcriptional regulator [Paenibacillus sp. GSMTC-2017]MBH5319602.1 TetR/AcrR family transcriptional regulator [Paenibacillus sp. GSMTC-2017]